MSVSCLYNHEEALEQTQDTLEELSLTFGLGMSWWPLQDVGVGWGVGVSGHRFGCSNLFHSYSTILVTFLLFVLQNECSVFF